LIFLEGIRNSLDSLAILKPMVQTIVNRAYDVKDSLGLAVIFEFFEFYDIFTLNALRDK
jgi:hypothetical protein